MATTPVVPAATALSWLQKHERLIIVALVLLAGAWGFSKFADLSASKAEARATAAETALTAQKAADAQNAATIVQLTQQYQQLTQTLAAQNAQLAASLAQRQTAQAIAVANDAHLAPSALATRLQSLGNALPEEVSVASDGKIDLTQTGAVKITQSLEQIAPLQADLKDTTDALQATRTAQSKADELISDQTKQITGLGLAAVEQDKVCKAQISVEKAKGRKGKIKFFKLGFVTGFVAGLWVGHAGL